MRTLASGMLVAQVAAFAATPLLTRVYDPAAFGAYALVLAMIAVGAPVAALRFDAAIALPEDRNEAWQLLVMGARAASGLAVALILLVWVGRPTLVVNGLIDRAAADLLPWLPILLLVAGLFQLGSAWHVRERAPAVAARGRAAQGFVTAAAQAVLGFVFSISGGLVIGDLIGRLSGVLALVRRAGRPAASGSATNAALLRRYRGFATYSSLAALVNALNGALPVLVVGSALGLPAAGLLLLAQRVASLPATLLTTAVSQVLAVDLARAVSVDARVALYRSTQLQLMRLVFPVFGIIAILSPFFGQVFGDQWRSAGMASAALVPFYAAQLLSGATIVAVDVMQAHGARLVRELLYLVGMLVVLVVATSAHTSLALVGAAISAFGVLFYTLSLRWVGRRLERQKLP